jgi:hypothetical protein
VIESTTAEINQTNHSTVPVNKLLYRKSRENCKTRLKVSNAEIKWSKRTLVTLGRELQINVNTLFGYLAVLWCKVTVDV